MKVAFVLALNAFHWSVHVNGTGSSTMMRYNLLLSMQMETVCT